MYILIMKIKTFLILITLIFTSITTSAKLPVRKPSKAYEFEVYNLIPKMEYIFKAKHKSLIIENIHFNDKRNYNLKPSDVYILFQLNYKSLRMKIPKLPEIMFKNVSSLKRKDIYILIKRIDKILAQLAPIATLSKTNKENYLHWKEIHRNGGKTIAPADMFYLNIHLKYLIERY